MRMWLRWGALALVWIGAPAGAAAEAPEGTQARMTELVEALRIALPLSLDDEAFASPANRDRLEHALRRLRDGSSALADHGQKGDVGFSHLSSTLAHDAMEIHHRFVTGRVDEARFLLGELSSEVVDRLGGEIMGGINAAAAVTPISLLAYVLLATPMGYGGDRRGSALTRMFTNIATGVRRGSAAITDASRRLSVGVSAAPRASVRAEPSPAASPAAKLGDGEKAKEEDEEKDETNVLPPRPSFVAPDES